MTTQFDPQFFIQVIGQLDEDLRQRIDATTEDCGTMIVAVAEDHNGTKQRTTSIEDSLKIIREQIESLGKLVADPLGIRVAEAMNSEWLLGRRLNDLESRMTKLERDYEKRMRNFELALIETKCGPNPFAPDKEPVLEQLRKKYAEEFKE
jgi:hypothetical protein